MAVLIENLGARLTADAASVSPGERPGERRIASILRQLGWQSASDEPAEAVAPALAMLMDACARGHHDLRRLYRDLAAQLRAHAHALDGGSSSASAWEPLAVALVDRYVNT